MLPQGASVTCEVVEGQKGPVVSLIHAVDISTASGGRTGSDRPGRGSRHRRRRYDEPAKLAGNVRGTVKFYDAGRGFGFVSPDGGGRDVFVHGTVLSRSGLDGLEPRQRVSVMVRESMRGPQATDIALISGPAPTRRRSRHGDSDGTGGHGPNKTHR